MGIGPTKTIAKLANKVAKGDRNGPGVTDLSTADARALIYPTLPVSEVWGMGPASVAKLRKLGVESVADLVALDAEQVRDMLTVTGQRTHAELRGISCIPFSEAPPSRKSIACTRSFGRAVTDWDEMREAVAAYTTRAAEKLRRFGLKAGAMQVFMRTNEFNGDPWYSNQAAFDVEPTADAFALIGAATRAARGLWRNGYRYAKAGVVLIDLYKPDELPIGDLFASRDPEKSKALMTALDAVNGRFGRGTLRPGAVAREAGWSMRRSSLSPCYTTRLSDLLAVKA